jgi:hypothetical protein
MFATRRGTPEKLWNACSEWCNSHKFGLANSALFLSGAILLTFGGLGESQKIKMSTASKGCLFAFGAACVLASIIIAILILRNDPDYDFIPAKSNSNFIFDS